MKLLPILSVSAAVGIFALVLSIVLDENATNLFVGAATLLMLVVVVGDYATRHPRREPQAGRAAEFSPASAGAKQRHVV